MTETPNLNYIEDIAKGNALFINTLIGIIKKELSGEIETYRLNVANGHWDKTSKDVHKLSHKIQILGLPNGYKIAETYSKGLLKNDLRLRLDFEGILKAMLLFIKNL